MPYLEVVPFPPRSNGARKLGVNTSEEACETTSLWTSFRDVGLGFQLNRKGIAQGTRCRNRFNAGTTGYALVPPASSVCPHKIV